MKCEIFCVDDKGGKREADAYIDTKEELKEMISMIIDQTINIKRLIFFVNGNIDDKENY